LSKFDFDRFKKKFRRVHNLQVKQAITSASAIKSTKAKISLLNDCLIDINDTAQLIELKSHFFWFHLSSLSKKIDATASFPIGWTLKPGDNIAQLAIIYRVKEKPRSGNYSIYIPHFTGNKSLSIPSLFKGSFGVVLELKDNSKITIYAKNHDYGKDYISKHLMPLVNKNYRTNNYKFIHRKNIVPGTMQPLRGDYYPGGRDGESRPQWRHYF
jgi:hypothetical protein